jgi:hypothetical protein
MASATHSLLPEPYFAPQKQTEFQHIEMVFSKNKKAAIPTLHFKTSNGTNKSTRCFII